MATIHPWMARRKLEKLTSCLTELGITHEPTAPYSSQSMQRLNLECSLNLYACQLGTKVKFPASTTTKLPPFVQIESIQALFIFATLRKYHIFRIDCKHLFFDSNRNLKLHFNEQAKVSSPRNILPRSCNKETLDGLEKTS